MGEFPDRPLFRAAPSTAKASPVHALDAQTLLKAYAIGVFPMAMARRDPELYWFDPDTRGIIPLDAFHVPRRLARTLRSGRFAVSADQAFGEVMRYCALSRPGHPETWINDRILDLYGELHDNGHAHSVECWNASGEMVGGLYGVSIGAAFFGESMFSLARDASKVALCALVGWLSEGGFKLLDTQYLTPHLKQFGTVEIPRAEYHRRLKEAIAEPGRFYSRAASSSLMSSSMLGLSAGSASI